MKKYFAFLLILLVPFLVFAQDIEKNYEIKVDNTEFSINEFFGITTGNISWNVTDPSVASVVDGTIIPIKAGSTIITTTIQDQRYVLYLTVSNTDKKVVNTNKNINEVMADADVKNPKTGDAMILLITVIALSLITSLFLSYIMKHNRYEEE